jgi:hypothetical protein
MAVLYVQGLAADQQIEKAGDLVETAIKKISKIEKLVKHAWALSPAQQVTYVLIHCSLKLTESEGCPKKSPPTPANQTWHHIQFDHQELRGTVPTSTTGP